MRKLPSREEVKKEIIKNRNHSWYREIVSRHESEPKKVILKYWGNEITYNTFFQESFVWAKALKQNKIHKGTEFVVCMDRTPEIVYLLGAASIIGAEIHLISEKFENNYIIELINHSSADIIFIQDTKIHYMKDVIKQISPKKIIPIPYQRSLKNNNPFEKNTNQYYYLL